MNKYASSPTLLASALALSLSLAPAQALINVTSVASFGSDSNPCTRPLPCRTLQVAHNNTNPGGIIQVLDPAGYGPVVITKTITIANDGAGISTIQPGVAAAPNVTINAATTDNVSIRGFLIEGSFGASTGTSSSKPRSTSAAA